MGRSFKDKLNSQSFNSVIVRWKCFQIFQSTFVNTVGIQIPDILNPDFLILVQSCRFKQFCTDGSHFVQNHLKTGSFYLVSNTEPFDNLTDVYHSNTGLVPYSDPHYSLVSNNFLKETKKLFKIISFEENGRSMTLLF